MAAHPRAFSEMAISMVRAGSEGGFLEDALARVAQFTEQQQDLKGRTTGALAYPAFLAVVGVSVGDGDIAAVQTALQAAGASNVRVSAGRLRVRRGWAPDSLDLPIAAGR